MRPARGHRAHAHTADVILEAWGPDVAACCEEAVAALVDSFLDVAHAAPIGERSLRLGPGDPEAVLVELLEDVVFLLDTAEGVPVGARVTPVEGGAFEAAVTLAAPESVEAVGAGPKAISLSELQVRAGPDGVRGRFLVDV